MLENEINFPYNEKNVLDMIPFVSCVQAERSDENL